MTNAILANHASLADRHPVEDHLVYGYETVSHTAGGKLVTDLFAITTDGQAYHRKTTSRREFNNIRARWTKIDPADIPAGADYVGTYLDDCRRQRHTAIVDI